MRPVYYTGPLKIYHIIRMFNVFDFVGTVWDNLYHDTEAARCKGLIVVVLCNIL